MKIVFCNRKICEKKLYKPNKGPEWRSKTENREGN